jgi:hypothetical protein
MLAYSGYQLFAADQIIANLPPAQDFSEVLPSKVRTMRPQQREEDQIFYVSYQINHAYAGICTETKGQCLAEPVVAGSGLRGENAL